MMRMLLPGLALLHLGPGFAFALLAFGCDAAAPVLAAKVCGMSVFASFAGLTAGAWLILGGGLGALHLLRLARKAVPPRPALRLAALLALLAEGALVAVAGAWLVGGQAWALAVPAALALGWWVLANPQACLPSAGRPPDA
jgi:hypothetical protein